MLRVLDTATVALPERAELVESAIRYAGLPAVLMHEAGEGGVHAVADIADLGGTAEFRRWTSSGYRLWRGKRQVSRGEAPRIALSVVSPGRWSNQQAGDERVVETRHWDVVLTDHASPYEFVRQGEGTTLAFNIDREALGLGVDQIHHAMGRLPASPMRGLVVQHMVSLAGVIDGVPPGPLAASLGSATADLARALILSALDPAQDPPDDTADALLTRMKLYIDARLADPGLDPGRIARAHAVSTRRLYQVWAGNDRSLAGYVMWRRLERARAMLGDPGCAPMTIAAVARRCGFVNMAHFSRRFRRAYQLSPREWRRFVTPTRS